MKKEEKLQDAIGMIGDDLIAEAKSSEAIPQKQKKKTGKKKWTVAIAACLALCIIFGAIFIPGGNTVSPNAYALALAQYPDMPEYPGRGDNEAKFDKWNNYRKEKRKAYYALDIDLDSFFSSAIREFLYDTDGENLVFSPLNIYMALAMTAELTDGESRAQILSLLGASNIETLRTQANTIWNATYVDDGSKKTVLASSLWLNDEISFKKDTLERIAENYYASSYSGDMGSANFTKAFQNWLNEQTGGLLEDAAGNVELNSEIVMALATTVDFYARWNNEFKKENTQEAIFYGTKGDIKCDFMYASYYDNYYWGSKFAAIEQNFKNGNSMLFILPDEGISAEELLLDEEAMSFILGERSNSKYLKVNRSIPKFDVSSTIDLKDGLKNLGITDIFSFEKSNFSPMTDDTDVAISKADHGARVVIDEEGCTAVAFTALLEAGASPPPDETVDFVLDRPFIFVITSQTGLPLFVGVVNNI